MWCCGFAEIYSIGGGGQSDIGICPLFYIYICHEMCQIWCSSIEGIYA